MPELARQFVSQPDRADSLVPTEDREYEGGFDWSWRSRRWQRSGESQFAQTKLRMVRFGENLEIKAKVHGNKAMRLTGKIVGESVVDHTARLEVEFRDTTVQWEIRRLFYESGSKISVRSVDIRMTFMFRSDGSLTIRGKSSFTRGGFSPLVPEELTGSCCAQLQATEVEVPVELMDEDTVPMSIPFPMAA